MVLILFNIDYPTFEFSTRAITYQVIAALIAPALAALIPIFKGARITVREAIASYGIGGDFGSNGLDRLDERVGSVFLSTPYAAALGNMFRRKGRLILTLLVLSTAGVMFLIVMSLISSTTLTLDNDMARRGYDFRIGFTRNQPSEDLVQTALDVEGVTAAEVWFSRNATILRAGERLQDSAGLGAQLIGLPAESGLYQPIITSGRWFEAGDGNVIVLSGETAEKNNIAVGDTINLNLGELGNSEWEVIGTYRVVYGGGFVIEAIYAPLEAVYDATGVQDEGTQIYIQTDRTMTSDIKQLSDDLRAVYEAEDKSIDLYTTSVVFEERDYANNQFQSMIGMFLGLAMLVATVGGIGLMGARHQRDGTAARDRCDALHRCEQPPDDDHLHHGRHLAGVGQLVGIHPPRLCHRRTARPRARSDHARYRFGLRFQHPRRVHLARDDFGHLHFRFVGACPSSRADECAREFAVFVDHAAN
ncbi:MAG: ABC transporter permease [Anaerolineales bacterium]|nr:MAG: ABC transporter permease [Anaerolineales bacterium]